MKKNSDFLCGFAAGLATSETIRMAVKLIKASAKKAISDVEKEYNETAEVDPPGEATDEFLK